MKKTFDAIINGIVAIAVVGAVLGIGAGTLAVVAIWIVRVLT